MEFKEIGVLMKPALAQAAHDENKTKTRRVIDCSHDIERIATPEEWNAGRAHPNMTKFEEWGPKNGVFLFKLKSGSIVGLKCKYGKPGDLIYIKEVHYTYGTWWRNGFTDTGRQRWTFEETNKSNPVLFPNNLPEKICKIKFKGLETGYYKRNSLFMPKRHVRTWARIKDIRVEYLNAITRSDIIKEGVCDQSEVNFMGKWIDLWDTINGKPRKNNLDISWEANPWVWVIEFERTEKPELI